MFICYHGDYFIPQKHFIITMVTLNVPLIAVCYVYK